MPENMDVETLRKRLRDYDQDHLLAFWDELDEGQRKKLYHELNNLDLEDVTQSFERCVAAMNADSEKLDDHMEPLPSDRCGSVLNMGHEESAGYEKASFEAIVEGRVAVLLLAGGQGTRLGVSYPKGMYDVGLPSKKSLFQLQAERLLRLQKLAEASIGRPSKAGIPWYIMTSASTVKPTTDFFKKNNYFGLEASNVVVFQQGTLPCFSFAGKIFMQNKFELARAPDGNGGLYRALRNDGILDDMKRRGVDYVQLYCVDNILVKVGDPLFTGYCIAKNAECANKVVPKGFPTESVGITCKVDGKYQVVEYSEITNVAAERRNADGSLTFSAANICIHFFTRGFLERVVSQHERDLVHHVAKKKIAFVDPATGKLVKPERPNGIKMEKFVFDVFQFAADDKFAVWECVREEEFAPLKNAEGASDFTPTCCRNALYALHQKYVLNAGGVLINQEGRRLSKMISPASPKEVNNNLNNNVDKNDSGDVEAKVVVCEISPLVSYAGEGLEKIVKGKRIPVPANRIGV